MLKLENEESLFTYGQDIELGILNGSIKRLNLEPGKKRRYFFPSKRLMIFQMFNSFKGNTLCLG